MYYYRQTKNYIYDLQVPLLFITIFKLQVLNPVKVNQVQLNQFPLRRLKRANAR